MTKTGLNMGSVKHQNRALILNHIYSNGPTSRKDIAKATGLTAASVTQIVARLISENVLVELGSSSEPARAAGRKKIPVDIKADGQYVFAVKMEPDVTHIALCDLKAQLVQDRAGNKMLKAIPTDGTVPPEEFLEKIADECKAFSEAATPLRRKRISAVSVGITGVVDRENGISEHAYGIWTKPVDIRGILSVKLGLPVYIENNVDAFATASLIFGTGKTHDNLFIIKWGPGVGGAIILNGQLYKAPGGRSAEFGHLIMDKDGIQCNCGRRGCLETLVSYRALNGLMPFELDNFEERFAQAPEDIKKQIEYRLDLFARSLINTATIVAPKRVVLFGKMFKSKTLCDMLISACKSYDPAYDEKRVMRTRLTESEGYIGPAAVFVQHFFDTI